MGSIGMLGMETTWSGGGNWISGVHAVRLGYTHRVLYRIFRGGGNFLVHHDSSASFLLEEILDIFKQNNRRIPL